jgi:hypothetical protein
MDKTMEIDFPYIHPLELTTKFGLNNVDIHELLMLLNHYLENFDGKATIKTINISKFCDRWWAEVDFEDKNNANNSGS